ncbi:MAG: hypothetical protein AAB426_12855, partial [Myxococcota bacterium]
MHRHRRSLRQTLWLLAFAFVGGAGCGGSKPPSSTLHCDTSADCDADARHAGELCVDGTCGDCGASGECAGTAYYGVGAVCAAGSCQRVCGPGSIGCVCAGGGVCDDALVCDGTSNSCREARTCSAITCQAHQLCGAAAAPGVDAACLPACEPGFAWGAASSSCEQQLANCQEGAPGSIKAACDTVYRECGENNEFASCGACVGGYEEDGAGACAAVAVTCEALACEGALRACETSPSIHCGACLPGYVQDIGDGTCRVVKTCVDVEASCDAGEICVAETLAADAFCGPADSACPTPPVACTPGWAWDPNANGGVGACHDCSSVTCDAGANAALTGSLYFQVSQFGDCICETKAGYFFASGAGIGYQACDADADGWVRRSAWPYLHSGDCALRGNARCNVRAVSSVRIEDDEGGTTQVDLATSEFSPVITTGKLELYELNESDDLSLRTAANELPAYRNGVSTTGSIPAGVGRPLEAGEINMLTKACVNPISDFNGNGVADLTEWQEMPGDVFPGGSTGTPDWVKPFALLSYFAELYEGFYEPNAVDASAAGTYVITEKSRQVVAPPGGSAQTLALAYTSGDFWRLCHRKRDSAYRTPIDAARPNIGMDFARYARSTSVLGPGHHSQFKCVQVVDPAVMPVDPRTAPQLLSTASSDFQLNSCWAQASSVEIAPGAANPLDPVVDCTATDLSLSNFRNAVAFVSAKFLQYD